VLSSLLWESEELLEPEDELPPESSPGIFGGGAVGNGCWSAAEGAVVEGVGELGGGAGLLGSPGNGNCWAVDGLLVSGGGAGQGFPG
jgi:hypothetical protein